MLTVPACPQCTLGNTYADAGQYVCADCGFEWQPDAAADEAMVVRDCNGNLLAAGDTVTVIKDLKVKGASIPLKQGSVIRASCRGTSSGSGKCSRSSTCQPPPWPGS